MSPQVAAAKNYVDTATVLHIPFQDLFAIAECPTKSIVFTQEGSYASAPFSKNSTGIFTQITSSLVGSRTNSIINVPSNAVGTDAFLLGKSGAKYDKQNYNRFSKHC